VRIMTSIKRLFKKELALPVVFLLLCFSVIWFGSNVAFAEGYPCGYEAVDETYAPAPEQDAYPFLRSISFPIVFDENYLSATFALDLEIANDNSGQVNVISNEFKDWNFDAINIHGGGILYEPIIEIAENGNLIFYISVCAIYRNGDERTITQRPVRVELSISPEGCFYYSVVRL